MKTKLAQVREMMACGDMRGAVLMAAKFADLGNQRNAILSAREAYLRPTFQKQIGKNPDALIRAGIAALHERFSS